MKSEYLNNKDLEEIINRFNKAKKDISRYEFILADVRLSNEKRQSRNKDSIHDLEYYQACHLKAKQEFEYSQKDLANAFYTLAEHLTIYAKDIIVDVDDAIQECVMICFKRIDRFNPEKGKAFNYLTTCIIHHLRQMYRTYKSYKMFKDRYRDFLSIKFEDVIIHNGKKKYWGD